MEKPTCTIPGCGKTKIMARGWCGTHYKRWYRHGDPLAQVNRRAPNGATPEERLRDVGWTIIQRRPDLTPCWEWDGLTDRAGYGRIWDGERVAATHRVAFATWAGPLAPTDHVLHRCDNPPCMNPEHLHPGDDATNMAEMVTRKRAANGERRPHKLTDADVAAIRKAYTGERGQQTHLAEQYGVAQSRISVIVRGLARTEETHWEAQHDRDLAVRARRSTI